MATPFVNNPVAGPTGRRVGEPFHNANQADYAWPAVPVLLAPGQKALHSGAGSYLLENLDNMVYSSAEPDDYRIGSPAPAGKSRGKATISYTMAGKHGPSDPWPLETPSEGAHAKDYWDSYMALDAQHRSRAYQRRDYYLAAHLVSATYGQLTFTGTQKLDERDTTGDQSPFRDMTTRKLAIMKYWRPGLKLVGIGNPIFWAALQSHLELTGAGQGSGVVNFKSEDEVMAVVKSKLGLDTVINLKAIVNSAQVGVTASVNYNQTGGFFWLGLLDARTNFLFNTDMGLAPDGAFALAQVASPWVKIWHDEEREIKLAADRDEFGFFAIRGSDMGVCWTQNIT